MAKGAKPFKYCGHRCAQVTLNNATARVQAQMLTSTMRLLMDSQATSHRQCEAPPRTRRPLSKLAWLRHWPTTPH